MQDIHRRITRNAALLCAATLLLSGCGSKPKSEEWYSNNLKEAETKVRWCMEPERKQKLSQNPSHPDAQDCQHAYAAVRNAQFKRMTGQ